ncbi:MGDG synthase family glycosyltransferase [Pseudalkalibacillus sp. A8]|uniref:MGDG synthase family glycosyltransferase n=1 Tax=Pseudalkalibacillus sp. A8 TaxID=3382641 RepID=UPI0038B55477
MNKVLIMPLLTISSGHHHVADTISRELREVFDCEKIELISYVYGKGEMAVSHAYLGWIRTGPAIYSNVYKRLAKSRNENNFSHRFYQKMFMKSIRQIIERYKPDLIVCTHGLPSCLLNHLKGQGAVKVPIINVYTDFVINNLWGKDFIDLHLVPDTDLRNELVQRGVEDHLIVTSGIPVDRNIIPIQPRKHQVKNNFRVIISGGNLGTGRLYDFIKSIQPSGRIHYSVLCGKNYRLLSQIKSLNNKFITAYPYIESKVEMNDLYEQSDAIITKPGGVTLSECLMKRLPIFIYDCLPGQEEYNLAYLKKHQLCFSFIHEKDIEKQILYRLDNEMDYRQLQEKIQQYHQRIEPVNFPNIFMNLIRINRMIGLTK